MLINRPQDIRSLCLFISLSLYFSVSRILVNVSGAPILWCVSEEGFQCSSVREGTMMWFQQAQDGLVVPDHSLPLGQNYFLSKHLVPPQHYSNQEQYDLPPVY